MEASDWLLVRCTTVVSTEVSYSSASARLGSSPAYLERDAFFQALSALEHVGKVAKHGRRGQYLQEPCGRIQCVEEIPVHSSTSGLLA